MPDEPLQPNGKHVPWSILWEWVGMNWVASTFVLGLFIGGAYWGHIWVGDWWATSGSLVPAFLIMQQGIYVQFFKVQMLKATDSRVFRAAHQENPTQGSLTQGSSTGTGDGRLESFKKEAQAQISREFGWGAISVDYLFSTVLAAVAGLESASLLVFFGRTDNSEMLGPGFTLPDGILEGAIYGALGAYVYVLLTLAERSFQRDISPGVAYWSAAQLFLGPILGGVVAAIWVGDAQQNGFSNKVLYFFAGLGPRQIVTVLQDAARRFIAGGQQVVIPKLIPLQTVRGINQRIEDRLVEEGITDGYMLAMADPIRMFRNTPFDLRQILAWIDECLLRAAVPAYADALQQDGISGAIDLAYYWEMQWGQPDIEKIAELAKRVFDRLEKPPEDVKQVELMLQDVSRRLDEDHQVLHIWQLYKTVNEEFTREKRPPPVAPQ